MTRQRATPPWWLSFEMVCLLCAIATVGGIWAGIALTQAASASG